MSQLLVILQRRLRTAYIMHSNVLESLFLPTFCFLIGKTWEIVTNFLHSQCNLYIIILYNSSRAYLKHNGRTMSAFACMFMCAMCMQHLRRTEENIISSRNWVIDDCELPCRCCEATPDPLEERLVILTEVAFFLLTICWGIIFLYTVNICNSEWFN